MASRPHCCGAAGIGRDLGERLQPVQRLGVAHGARASQGTQRGAAVRRSDVHDDDAQPRHGAHLHPAGRVQRGRGERARPQADDDRVGRVRDAGASNATRSDEDGDGARAEGVGEACGRALRGDRVTAHARRVPDV